MRLSSALRSCESIVETVWQGSLQRIEQAITPSLSQRLRSSGFAVVDNILTHEAAVKLAEEIEDMGVNTRGSLMHKNSTHLVDKSGATQLLEKEHIWELDPRAPEIWEAATASRAPLLRTVEKDSSLAKLLNKYTSELRLDAQALKVQYNEGDGGCFPMHLDSDPDLDSRQLTAIFYLNQDWEPHHGGMLRLYPFPYKPVDIAPTFNRLVLFSCPNMIHRVLPSTVQRKCFTIWYSSSRRGRAAAQPAKGASLQALLEHHKYRNLLAKAVYAEEWADSIIESHADSDARQSALAKHWKDVEIIKKVFAQVLPRTQRLVDALSMDESVDNSSTNPYQDNGGKYQVPILEWLA
mmetsp:Transcript_22695/g.43377  ORF Transcript_22695/g.43377 Transcript_22695/m.43377 type:complete len:351 (-) Transcript_22695:378-1430(-)